MAKFNLKKFLALVQVLAPVVLASVKGGDKIAEYIGPITTAIGEAQQIKGASGPEKKAHVLEILGAAIEVTNASRAHDVDPAEVKRIASEGIDQTIAKIHEVEKVVADAK